MINLEPSLMFMSKKEGVDEEKLETFFNQQRVKYEAGLSEQVQKEENDKQVKDTHT